MIDGILESLLKLTKPLENMTYKYYENNYLFYVVIGIVLLLMIGMGFLIFKFVMSFFT